MNLHPRLRCLVWALVLGWTSPVHAANRWIVKEGCTLIPNPANDGDSFHVRYKSDHYIFRLYFVDAPETEERYPDRVKEQAAYWGIKEGEAVRLGDKARKFTEQFLSGEFTVYTRYDDARGESERERFFALISVKGRDLGEALVEQGLARIYGAQAELPDGYPNAFNYHNRLKTAEREAQQHRLGGWSKIKESTAPPPTPTASKPAPPPASKPALPSLPVEVTLEKGLTVYSLLDASRQAGYLKPGSRIQVLRLESPTMLRIRFPSADRTYEAQCRRSDLGL